MKYFFKLKIKNNTKGFTLIELMVVVALFTTILVVAVGALFSAQAINTKLQQTQMILDGVNLSIEEMVRDIRYGSVFYCTNNDTGVLDQIHQRLSCIYPNGGNILFFKPANALTSTYSENDRIAYYISNGSLFKKEFPEGITTEEPVQITASDIIVENLNFYIKGAEANSTGDYIQPVVTLSISGVTNPSQPNVTPVRFSVQTTSSTRKIDQ